MKALEKNLRIHFLNGQLLLLVVDLVSLKIGVARKAWFSQHERSAFVSLTCGQLTDPFVDVGRSLRC